MTLHEAKDEIAKKYGYDNWLVVDFYQIDALNETKPGEVDAEHFLLDEAAELYARSKEDDAFEVLLECFHQACYQSEQADGSGTYDHMCLSSYELAQDVLIRAGKLKPEQCYRK